MDCCAECGKEEGGVSLKTCTSCKLVRYCNAKCQRNHWAKHKKTCKQRAAELHDEALFKDPPPKEECPICFLPMPVNLICCISLPSATVSSVPIFDLAEAYEDFAEMETEEYYSCCGKGICRGCIHSFGLAGNVGKCPFCNSDRGCKTDAERVAEMMKRVEAQDASAMNQLAQNYYFGGAGLLQDHAKAVELWKQAVALGSSQAHFCLAEAYRHELEDLKKAHFHYEAAAVAGHEVARCNLGSIERKSGNMELVLKHLRIAASAGDYAAMNFIRKFFERGVVSREAIDSTLTAYNNSCVEMRSEARDAYIRIIMRMHESTNNS